MRSSFKTADGCSVGIDSIYIVETMAGVLEGGFGFVWRVCVDDAPADMERHWGDHLPVHMLVPQGLTRARELPPRWRINVRLSNGLPLKDEHADGSHMGLIFFRDTIDDMPIDRIVAEAAAQVRWREVAVDWSF